MPDAPAYRRPLGLGREQWLQYAALAALALLVVAPVVPILYQSLLDRPLYEAGGVVSLDNYVRLFTEAGFGEVVLNTVYFCLLTTFITLLIAVPMAVVVVRTELPGGRLFAAAMQWPFFISSLILGFGWITMYGPAGFVSVQVRQLLGFVPWNLYSIPGMALTEAVALAPVAYTFCANALRQSDASLEAAAQVCGAGPLRILTSVVVPLLRPRSSTAPSWWSACPSRR
ncbi:ABC transporter permease [Actinomadura keratinilytica]|uniref:ABC transporter permease n=1 Tax=Actinomadura keratinilytica TaxID=547461 RepID=UPI003620ED15